jgi:hypothetical protein
MATSVTRAIRHLKAKPVVLLGLFFSVLVLWAFLGIKLLEYRASSQPNTPAQPTVSPAPKEISPDALPAIPPTTEPISPATESELLSSHKQIKEWAGTGKETTEYFEITEAPWVIIWSFEPRQQARQGLSLLQIYVRQPENAEYNELPVHIGSIQDTQQGSLYIDDTGNFYLRVYSESGSWNIKVLIEK